MVSTKRVKKFKPPLSCGDCKHYTFNETIARSERVSNSGMGWFCKAVNFEISNTAFHLIKRVGCIMCDLKTEKPEF